MCGKFDTLHFPWNRKKYKRLCEETGCVHRFRLFGSRCKDPVTATKDALEKAGVNKPEFISMLTREELKFLLVTSNHADKIHLVELENKYFPLRKQYIEDLATGKNLESIKFMNDIDLFKLLVNSKEEKIPGVYDINVLILLREQARVQCYNKTFSVWTFEHNDRYQIERMLKKCGIEEGSRLYDRAIDEHYRHYRDPHAEHQAFHNAHRA